MTNKTLLAIHALIYESFAVLLFFFADFMWPFYGLEINDEYARFLSQHNSIFLGGLGILCWLVRHVEPKTDIAYRIFLGLFWTNSLGVAITLYACFKGVFSGFGWSDPAFFLAMSLLCLLQAGKNRHR